MRKDFHSKSRKKKWFLGEKKSVKVVAGDVGGNVGSVSQPLSVQNSLKGFSNVLSEQIKLVQMRKEIEERIQIIRLRLSRFSCHASLLHAPG
jgi:hypothetical protein